MDFLKTVLKEVKNEYAGIVEDGIMAGDVVGWIDTGSFALNALLSGTVYGGIPSNKITAFASDSGFGKTFFTLGILKNFLDDDKESVCTFFESESAISKDMMVSRGIDPKRVAVFPVETVEKFKTQSLRVTNSYLESGSEKPLLMILDSLGNLSTSKEMTDSAEGKETKDLTRSQVIKACFRVLTLKQGKANIPMVITNHVYSTFDQYAPKEQSGGSGSKYAASTTIYLSKAKATGEDVGEGSTAKNRVGSIITCTTMKSRLTREQEKVKVLLTYDNGLDRYYGLMPLAIEAGVFVKNGNKYDIVGFDKPVWKKAILSEPETYYTETVLEQIDEFCAKKFLYGITTEEEDEEIIDSDSTD